MANNTTSTVPRDFGTFGNMWVTFGVIIYAAPIITVNVVGNTLVIVTFVIDASLRSSSRNIYMTNLAVADLVQGITTMPMFTRFTMARYVWDIGGLNGCKFALSLNRWLKTEANLSIIMISYDLMLMIRNAMRYDRRVGVRQKAIKNVILTWIISFIAHFPVIFLFEKTVEGGTVLRDGICQLNFNTGDRIVWYAVVFAAFELLYPVVLLTTFCSTIAFSIWKRGRGVKVYSDFYRKTFEKERTLCHLLCYMVGFYAICWTPYTVVYLVKIICGDCVGSVVPAYLLWWLWLHTAINPIHYYHADPRFRVHFRRILCPCIFRGCVRPSRSPVLVPVITVQCASEPVCLAEKAHHMKTSESCTTMTQEKTIFHPLHKVHSKDLLKVPTADEPYQQAPGQQQTAHKKHRETTPKTYHPSHHIMELVYYESLIDLERVQETLSATSTKEREKETE